MVIVIALAVGGIIFMKRRKGMGMKRKSIYGSSPSELSGRLNELEEQQKGFIPQTTPIRYPDPDDMNELAGGRTQTRY